MMFWKRIWQCFFKNASGLSEKLRNGFFPRDIRPAQQKIIQRTMTVLLAKQFESAQKEKEASHHWGSVGWQVEQAADECERIIKWHEEDTVSEYFERVLPEIKTLAARYRNDDMDESGYALGTVREIENALITLSTDRQ